MRIMTPLPLIALFFCLIISNANAQETKSFTLDEAINYAMTNSTTVQNAMMNIEDADQQIVERRSIGLPQVSGQVNYQYFYKVPVVLLPQAFAPNAPREDREVSFQLRHNFNAGITLNSLIFDGSYLVGLRAAKLYREYVNQDLISKKQEVKTSVADAYLPSLIISESITMLDKNLANIENLLEETKALYKEGFVEQLDVDRLELSKANLVSQRENLTRQRQLAIDALKFTISYPIDQELTVADNINALLIEATDEDLTKAMSYYDRPEYKVAETGIRLNELNVEQFRAGYLPNVVGFISFTQGFQGDELNTDIGFWAPQGVVGATINIPIYDGGDKKAKIQRAKIQLATAKNQVRDLERLIDLQVANARGNYLNARDRVANQQKNLDLAEQIYETTQIKYKEGVGSSLEISNAEQSLYQSQQNYTQALYDLLVAKTELNKALGK
ncbi:MAG: TolC family protein [Bacteroidota bacterium]